MKKLLAFFVFSFFALLASAQPYKIYVSFPAGVAPDVFTRKLVDRAEALSDKKFIVINRPGGEFMVGYRAFLQDASNKTLYLSTVTTHVVPYVVKNQLDVDPLNEAKPLLEGARINYTLAVKNDSPITKLSDVAGKINIGYIGTVAPILLSSLNLSKDVQLVPYKSESEVIFALKSGDIQVAQISNGQQISKNDLRLIWKFDNILTGFIGVHANKNMPDSEVNEINALFNSVLQAEDMQQFLKDQFASVARTQSPQQFDLLIKRSIKQLNNITHATISPKP